MVRQARFDTSTVAGRFLNRALDKSGLTIAEIARRSGLSADGVTDISKPGANPTKTTLEKVATAMEIPVGDLVAAIFQVDNALTSEQLRAKTELAAEAYMDLAQRLNNAPIKPTSEEITRMALAMVGSA